MLKFKFNKLVRDKIVDLQISSGARPQYRTLTDKQHKEALVKKIIEEAGELKMSTPKDLAMEIADVQQAIDDLLEKLGLKASDIKREQKLKNDKSGSFKKGLFIDYVEVDNDDKWVSYYRENPDRYPEIS